MVATKNIVISPYFDNNVILVANMCTKCYSARKDVSIVSVNKKFLKNTQHNNSVRDLLQTFLETYDGFRGFSEQETRLSLASTNSFIDIAKLLEKKLKDRKEEEDLDFCGFTNDDVFNSSVSSVKAKQAVKKVTSSVYRKIGKRIFTNTRKDSTKQKSAKNYKSATYYVKRYSPYFKPDKVTSKKVPYTSQYLKREKNTKLVVESQDENDSDSGIWSEIDFGPQVYYTKNQGRETNSKLKKNLDTNDSQDDFQGNQQISVRVKLGKLKKVVPDDVFQHKIGETVRKLEEKCDENDLKIKLENSVQSKYFSVEAKEDELKKETTEGDFQERPEQQSSKFEDKYNEVDSQKYVIKPEPYDPVFGNSNLEKLKKEVSEDVFQNSITLKSCFIKTKIENHVPIFIPPKSPHNLIEEDLYHDPWALLVATIFLNRTSCQVARPYVFWFLGDNPDPFTVLRKKPEDFEKYFLRLGLQKTRAVQVWRMSYDFLFKKWKNVKELYGVGKYGDDAFRMFCLGDFSVEPKDRFLKIYKAWYQMTEKEGRIAEMNR